MSAAAQKTPALLSESDLDPEQQAAITRLYEHDESLLVAGVGFGKAVVGLTALQLLIKEGHLKRVLVLAPMQVATLTWGSEPDKWAHIDPALVAVACGGRARRVAAFDSGAPVVVTNFENIAWTLDNYGHLFDGLLIDEISKLKSVGGTGPRKLRNWVPRLKWRAGMSANPVAEAGADIYGQALLLDLGKALGTRKQAFLERYFYPEDYERRRWAFKPGGDLEVSLALQRLLWFADDSRYKGLLPELRRHEHRLALPSEAVPVYAALEQTGIARNAFGSGRDVVAKSAGVRALKLFQMAAGGLYAGEDEDRELLWWHPYKVQAAIELVDALPPMQCCVIVYQYTFELEALRDVYPTAPVLGGGARFTTADLGNWNRRNHKVLLMHPNSAAHGLNLQQGAHTLIQLSPIWGADPGQQVPGRLRRRGQPNPWVDHHVLIAEGTRDESAVAAVERKSVAEAEFMKISKNI